MNNSERAQLAIIIAGGIVCTKTLLEDEPEYLARATTIIAEKVFDWLKEKEN